MSDHSVFEKLADTLPENERKDLLHKINRSMSFRESGGENIFQRQLTLEEREALIKKDLEHLSFLARFMLWIRSLVSGKSKKDLLVTSKLRALKAAINRKQPGLTGFETRDITAKFAAAVFEFYRLTVPLAPIYRKLLLRSRELEGAFVRLVEGRYPQTRVRLSDVVSSETLEEVYAEKGHANAVRRAAFAKFDEFASKLADQIFEEVEDAILPVYYLKDIVFFPYGAFFELFHCSLADTLPNRTPSFKNASAMLVLEYIERLYVAAYNALKISTPMQLDDDVADYLLRLRGEAEEESAQSDEQEADEQEADERPGPAHPNAPSSDGDEHRAEERAQMSSDFASLLGAVRQFDKRMPIVELIRYFLKDPYHRMYVYVTRPRLRDYYVAVVKVRLLAEIDELLPTLQVRFVDHKVARLFKDQQLVEFENYREYKTIDYEKLGLPFFSRTRSINLLYNFIRWYYRQFLQEPVKILATVILVQNRVTRNKLLQCATSIEDLEQKLRDFDAGLSPDTEEGKLFHRLRTTLAGDIGHQRMFRTIVLQKDVQVNSLVERGKESFSTLEKIFEEVYMTPSESIRERLSSRFYLNGKLQALSGLLKERTEYVRSFLAVLDQVLKLEEA